MTRAGDVYAVATERQAVSAKRRAPRWAVRLLIALIAEGVDPGAPDVSTVVYRIVVRDRASGRLVHVEEYGGDETAARDAHLRLARELATMDDDQFRAAYGI